MENEEGRQFLRDHVRWDPEAGGYWVTVYDKGEPQTVLVTEVIKEGTMTDGKPGIVSPYETAILDVFGWDEVRGKFPWVGPARVVGADSDTSVKIFSDIATAAEESGGSIDGGVTLAATLPNPFGEYWDAGVADADGNSITIQVPENHVLEVVEIRPDGMIGIRNPWGYWRVSGAGESVSGVVYLTLEEFNGTFMSVTVTR
jgi:hypothetical protein